ncbi:MAG: hypothetical protein N2450_00710 [bacterium]|nr:hypothetical protein [bacterium]
MAEKLLKYYIYIEEQKGIAGKAKLAMITKIPILKAAIVPDSKENIELFKRAIETITGKTAPNF